MSAWVAALCAFIMAKRRWIPVSMAQSRGSEPARQVGFAGLGPGELTIGGRKVVGISQRRSRTHARFQVAILRRWSGSEHAALLAGPDHASPSAADALETVAAGIDVDPVDLLAAVGAALPA